MNKSCVADPTYMIRAIPSNASDNVFCTLLAQSAVHGAMAGYTGFTVGPVNGRNCYIPFHVSYCDSLISLPHSFSNHSETHAIEQLSLSFKL